jgi:acetate kinase
MDDYALVFNAGSSSLKFCVYHRPEGTTGTSKREARSRASASLPRFSAKDGAADTGLSVPLDQGVRDVAHALDSLASWLRSKYGGARVLGVGHRVVHGGRAIHRTHRDHSSGSGGSAGAHSSGSAPSTV